MLFFGLLQGEEETTEKVFLLIRKEVFAQKGMVINMIKEKIIRVLKAIPRFMYIVLGIAVFAFFLHLIAILSPRAADVLCGSISFAVRAFIAYITSIFPFSLAEIFLLGIPLWIFLLVLFIRRQRRKGVSGVRLLCLFLAVLPILYILFVFTMGFGYAGSNLEEKMSLSMEDEISAEELFAVASWLAQEANALAPTLTYGENGESLMPYGHRGMNQKLIEAYRTLSHQYDFVSTFSVGVKPVLLSYPMAFTGITGVYSFFTGEANLNTAYPDYSNVFTAAHEMAHARGIAREDEANFVAFLALESSEDDYLRYAGYVNLLQYVLNALAKTDRERYRTAYFSLSESVKNEYKAYNAFLDKVDGSVARDVAEKVNNTYLQSMGTEGTISYDLVVNLAVAYYKAK